MRILITGGAGYIGSHAVKALTESHTVTVVDNLTRGYRDAVPSNVNLYTNDVREISKMTQILRSEKIDAVLHFAGLAYVGESVAQPLRYYQVNVDGTLSLLAAMKEVGVNQLVFSSSCATYGTPDFLPITEQTPQRPINPYGWSKLMAEQLIKDVAASRPNFSYALLRYFNVAGCATDGTLGERHNPEPHLIPLALRAVLNPHQPLIIHGDDYATEDGTCQRDYLHVEDVVLAHQLVLEALQTHDRMVYNLGLGHPYSVRDIIAAVATVTGSDVPIIVGTRRLGDPPCLYADASSIRTQLGWQPTQIDLVNTIASSWRWLKGMDAYPRY
ncbi:UDP-glucose 4-epimerase GalE [Candidatus Berkelbacteria bacterium]|nr:UDP-glucose 4-epimerase GalE [Candidatus Berkelbacteria bacterium]